MSYVFLFGVVAAAPVAGVLRISSLELVPNKRRCYSEQVPSYEQRCYSERVLSYVFLFKFGCSCSSHQVNSDGLANCLKDLFDKASQGFARNVPSGLGKQ